MLHYAEKQVDIQTLERALQLLSNYKTRKGKDTDLEKFITPQYYPIRTMIENLSSSTSALLPLRQLLF
jgi:hypothetical protein